MTPREQAEAVILLTKWLVVAKRIELSMKELIMVAQLETETSQFLHHHEIAIEASS